MPRKTPPAPPPPARHRAEPPPGTPRADGIGGTWHHHPGSPYIPQAIWGPGGRCPGCPPPEPATHTYRRINPGSYAMMPLLPGEYFDAFNAFVMGCPACRARVRFSLHDDAPAIRATIDPADRLTTGAPVFCRNCGIAFDVVSDAIQYRHEPLTAQE